MKALFRKWIWVVPVAALPFSAFSQDQGADLKIIQRALDAAKQGTVLDPCQGAEPGAVSISCGKLSDRACDQIWKSKPPGDLVLPDGQIHADKYSDKSDVSYTSRADLIALLDSEARLPGDLKKVVAPIFADYRRALQEEEDSDSWYRKMGDIHRRWGYALNDVAKARAEALDPSLKTLKVGDRTVIEDAKYREQEIALDDEVLKAKYQSHPNWKRVERLFNQAKSDILASIAEMPVDQAFKEKLTKKVSSVDLTLPVSDPRKLDQERGCDSTLVNAFYSPTFNKFTVCAGLFNSYQMDSTLYTVIAHEIGHSIDTSNVLQDEFEKAPIVGIAKKLAIAKGAELSCSDWDKMLKDVRKPTPADAKPKTSPLSKIAECMSSRDKLLPFEATAVHSEAQRQTVSQVSDAATMKNFTWLAASETTRRGEKVSNPFYMRPDLLGALNNGGVVPTVPDLSGNELYGAFVQSLSCKKAKVNGKEVSFAGASKEDRSKLFSQAIEDAQAFKAALKEQSFWALGRESHGLQSARLSRVASEDFADWIAAKALPRFLSRIPQETRQEAAGLSTALFCRQPDATTFFPELTSAEKKFSLEPHPEDSVRRHSFYKEKTAEVVGCSLDKNPAPGVKQCEL